MNSYFIFFSMKVLFVTNEFSHPDLRETGGVGRFYKELSDELVSCGHEVFVLGTNHVNLNCLDGGISFHIINKIFLLKDRFRLLSLVVNRVLLLIHFISFIKKHKIDVIELNEPFTAYMISFFKGNLPMILRQHGMHSILSVMYGNKINKIVHFFEKKAHYYSDKIISVSKYTKKLVLDLYGRDLSVDVIYNGIRINDYEANPEKEFNRSLLYVAALSDKKGYFDLVNIFNEINRIDDTVVLVIIGRESEFSFKTLKFTESALDNIEYIGYLDYDKLCRHYGKSNLFLNFSKGETFGLTTIEAMSHNIPVVISNIGVADEIVKNGVTGYVVNLHNKEEVLDKIFKILNDFSLQTKMGRLGGEIVIRSFTNKLMYQKTLDVYKKTQIEIK